MYYANIKEETSDPSQPINQYRIVYTQKGIKKPLSGIQKKFSYGRMLIEAEPDLFKFRLASRK